MSEPSPAGLEPARTPTGRARVAPPADAPSALARDRALILRWRGGDTEAGNELLGYYSALVRLVAFRLGVRDTQEMTDLYQDVVLRVLETLPRLHERIEVSFAGWLAWQVRDLAQRRRRANRPAPSLPEAELACTSPDPAERSAAWDAIRSCQSKLPDREREVFELRYLSGLSLQEVAKAVDSNANAVAQSVFRLVRRMRACLRTQGYEMPGAEA